MAFLKCMKCGLVGLFGSPILLSLAATFVVAQARAGSASPLPSPPPYALGAPTLPESTQTQQHQGGVATPILAGAGLGVLGFFAGGLTASSIASDCTSHEFCQLEAAFYGAAAGGTLGLALGVHLGNSRRGNFALDFLTGAAVWGAGIGIAAASDWNETVTWTAFVAIPLAQLASTVAVERAVGRSRGRSRAVGMSVIPYGRHGAALTCSVSF